MISLWVRDVEISKRGQARLAKRNADKYKGARGSSAIARDVWSSRSKQIRETYREEGRLAAKSGDALHSVACALYWAEGSKTRSYAIIVNSDVHILRTFLAFYYKYFEKDASSVNFRISGYTGSKTYEQMVAYWVEALSLKKAKELSHYIDDFRYETKGRPGKREGKLPYGVCSISVQKSVRIVQHIYGAIEVYGGSVIDPKK